MTRHDRVEGGAVAVVDQLALHHLQVGGTDADVGHLDQHFVVGQDRHLGLAQLVGADRVDDHG